YGLSRAGGADGLTGESETGRGKTGDGRRTRAGEPHGLWAAGGVVGEGDGCAARSTRSGIKGNADRAVSSCRYACPTTIGLGKVAGVGARDCEASDTQGGIARI